MTGLTYASVRWTALIAGQHDPAALAELAKGRVRTKIDDLGRAVTGRIKDSHRLLLKLHLEHIAEQLLASPDLTGILLYHVVPGHISYMTLVAAIGDTGVKVVTLSGGLLSFNIVDGNVVINDGPRVITTDIEASNGVIHAIDKVLIPPE